MPINTKIQLRKGTESEWSSSNPVLASGEPGYVTDSNRFKIGDGVSSWNSLSYTAIVPSGFLAGSGININLGSLGASATISVSGLNSSYISDFNSAVSGLLPVKNIVAGTGIDVSASSGIFTITSTGSGVLSDAAKAVVTNVFNKTPNTINKGSVVYIDGGQGDQPTIQLAIASGEGGSSKTYGITAENILSMELGEVVVLGALTGFNTDQFNPTAPTGNVNGVTLYLSPSVSGAMTTTKPSAPDHLVSVGTIVRTHQNEGVIEVRIQNGFELEELHNVAISGVSNGQFLQYNSASGLWVPTSSGNFTNLQVSGTPVSISGHTHTSSNITDFNSSVSGLLPVKNIVAGSGIIVSGTTGTFTISASVGGGGTTISNYADNRLLTSDGTTTGINGESNLTFDGSTLRSNATTVIGENATTDHILNINKGSNTGGSFGIYYGSDAQKLRGIIKHDGGAGGLIIANQGSAGATNETNNIVFQNAASAAANYQTDATLTNRMVIRYDGNIGINTNNPLQKLDVRGNVYTSGNLGINTSSPSQPLHVIGSGLISSATGITPSALFSIYSTTSGTTLFNVEGTNGSLFSVVDSLSGTLMSVNNNAGLPVLEVFSDDKIVGGRFNQNDWVITSSGNVGLGTASPSGKLHVVGSGIFASGLNIANQTASTIASFDSNKNVVSLSTSTYPSLTELSYVKGVTSDIQTQLNGKSNTGHTHTSSDITNFNSSVSGLLPTIANSGDNRLLTSTGTTTGINAESNATFDGSTLAISGALTVDNLSIDGNTISSTNTDGNIIIKPNGAGALQKDSAGNARGSYAVDLQKHTGSNDRVASGGYSTIGGGRTNTCSGYIGTVGGGVYNRCNGYISSVGGGLYNQVTNTSSMGAIGGGNNNYLTANYATIAGGDTNNAGGAWVFIGGGQSNNASANYGVIVGGSGNLIGGQYGSIGGGSINSASGIYGTVGGGFSNAVGPGNYSTIGGGYDNTCSGAYSVVAGGRDHSATGLVSTIGGGQANTATAQGATIGGGVANSATAIYAIVGGGYNNNAVATRGFIGGGDGNYGAGTYGVICGGINNQNSNYGCIVGGSGNLTNANFASIGGGQGNSATGAHATIGGGNSNTASGTWSVVGGGQANTSSGDRSTVGGGTNNTASSYYSTVAGGQNNFINVGHATIGGGLSNTASSFFATISGGRDNFAARSYSAIVGGWRATTNKYGEVAHAAGYFANVGDAQHSILVARKTTTDATANQVLFLDNSSERLTIPAKTTWTFSVKISAYNDTDGEGGWWIIRGGIRRNGSNGTALIGSLISENGADSSLSTASASVVADDTNEALEIRVTGVASKNIRWVAVVDISQVSYGTP